MTASKELRDPVSAVIPAQAGIPVPRQESPGLWTLAWRRLKQDTVGMVSLAIVVAFLLMVVGVATGLVASDWNKEKGVS
jgi:oligopeptide transport system permease protein